MLQTILKEIWRFCSPTDLPARYNRIHLHKLKTKADKLGTLNSTNGELIHVSFNDTGSTADFTLDHSVKW